MSDAVHRTLPERHMTTWGSCHRHFPGRKRLKWNFIGRTLLAPSKTSDDSLEYRRAPPTPWQSLRGASRSPQSGERNGMSAVEKAFHGLRHMIATGCLGPGERIPPEGELCEELGVSRGSLREAVRMLAALGVIEPR